MATQKSPPILYINRPSQLRAFIKSLHTLPTNCVIGLDVEWIPPFLWKKERITLIQLACTLLGANVIDVLELSSTVTQDDWEDFFRAVFNSERVVTGFDLRHDLRVLLQTFPFLGDLLADNAARKACVYRLLSTIRNNSRLVAAIFDGSAPEPNQSLAYYAQLFLGMELNKAVRSSKWDERPLTAEQIEYAAKDADAVCRLFILICGKISERTSMQTMDFLQKACLVQIQKDELDSPSKGNVSLETIVQNVQVEQAAETVLKSVDDVRFIADSMLFGLGKLLRQCGFSVLLEKRNEIVRICGHCSSYVVLSSGSSCERIRRDLDDHQEIPVLSVSSSLNKAQQAAKVLKEMKVAVSEASLYSRCDECNGRCLVSVPVFVLRCMYVIKAARKGNYGYGPEAIPDVCHDMVKAKYSVPCRFDISQNSLICHLGEDQIDIANTMLFSAKRHSPVTVKVHQSSVCKEAQEGDLSKVCADCGNVYGGPFPPLL